ncbi:MAG: hypothetical protein ACJ789_21275 [Thermomicrobiales bacterium]
MTTTGIRWALGCRCPLILSRLGVSADMARLIAIIVGHFGPRDDHDVPNRERVGTRRQRPDVRLTAGVG